MRAEQEAKKKRSFHGIRRQQFPNNNINIKCIRSGTGAAEKMPAANAAVPYTCRFRGSVFATKTHFAKPRGGLVTDINSLDPNTDYFLFCGITFNLAYFGARVKIVIFGRQEAQFN
jgi:hypothetical protein